MNNDVIAIAKELLESRQETTQTALLAVETSLETFAMAIKMAEALNTVCIIADSQPLNAEDAATVTAYASSARYILHRYSRHGLIQ